MRYTRRDMLKDLAILAAAATPLVGRAQEFPSKSMKFVVPFAAGTTTDAMARFFAERIRTFTGQQVIVENKPGALGNIGAEAVARDKPDGHTVLFSGNNTHAANVHLFDKLPFDPQKDFEPLIHYARVPFILVVNPRTVPVKTLKEFVAFAKARPGKLSYASSSAGNRVAAELLKQTAGFYAVNIDYKSSPQAMMDTLSGQIDFYFGDPPLVMPHIRSGGVTALGVSMNQRVPTAPEVPTIAESGYPEYNLFSWIATWTTGGSPPEAVNAMARLLTRVIDSPEGRDFLNKRGLVPFPGTPQTLRELQTRDTEIWGRVIKASNMKTQ